MLMWEQGRGQVGGGEAASRDGRHDRRPPAGGVAQPPPADPKWVEVWTRFCDEGKISSKALPHSKIPEMVEIDLSLPQKIGTYINWKSYIANDTQLDVARFDLTLIFTTKLLAKDALERMLEVQKKIAEPVYTVEHPRFHPRKKPRDEYRVKIKLDNMIPRWLHIGNGITKPLMPHYWTEAYISEPTNFGARLDRRQRQKKSLQSLRLIIGFVSQY